KKMHFLLSSMSVVYVLTTLMPEDEGDNPTVEQNVKNSKELWGTLEAKYKAEDASSKKFIDNEKPKGNNISSPSVVNIVEHNNSLCKMTTKDCKAGNVNNKANGSGTKGLMDCSSNSVKGQNMLNKSLQPRENYFGCEFLWKEERVPLLISSPGASTTPSYSPGPSTPQSYSLGPSRTADYANCQLLIGKLQVLEPTLEMYMHPEKHTIDSTILPHELYNDMEKFSLE
ncbi:hypothetical protein Tco_0691568, partial [Tanacetum coccineum]